MAVERRECCGEARGPGGHRIQENAAEGRPGPSRGHALRNGNAHRAICSSQETAVGIRLIRTIQFECFHIHRAHRVVAGRQRGVRGWSK